MNVVGQQRLFPQILLLPFVTLSILLLGMTVPVFVVMITLLGLLLLATKTGSERG